MLRMQKHVTDFCCVHSLLGNCRFEPLRRVGRADLIWTSAEEDRRTDPNFPLIVKIIFCWESLLLILGRRADLIVRGLSDYLVGSKCIAVAFSVGI